MLAVPLRRTGQRERIELSGADDATLVDWTPRNREAFGILYDRYVDAVYGYCLRRLQSPQAAEDVTSQVFINALDAISRGKRGGGPFRAWLFTIAHHAVVDRVRRQRPAESLDTAYALAATGDLPEQIAIRHETNREMQAHIDALPGDGPAIVNLRMAGLTDVEIGRVLGKSSGAVRVAQHRAMQRLRASLDGSPIAEERSS